MRVNLLICRTLNQKTRCQSVLRLLFAERSQSAFEQSSNPVTVPLPSLSRAQYPSDARDELILDQCKESWSFIQPTFQQWQVENWTWSYQAAKRVRESLDQLSEDDQSLDSLMEELKRQEVEARIQDLIQRCSAEQQVPKQGEEPLRSVNQMEDGRAFDLRWQEFWLQKAGASIQNIIQSCSTEEREHLEGVLLALWQQAKFDRIDSSLERGTEVRIDVGTLQQPSEDESLRFTLIFRVEDEAFTRRRQKIE